MSACLTLAIALLPTAPALGFQAAAEAPPADDVVAAETDPTVDVTQGALRIEGEDGQYIECPLKHTDVRADISGFIARVTVTQTFQNPTDEPIEAVYVFPLPHQAAVDDMTMVIGERRIVGSIQKRDDARRIYEQAIASGQTASLLEQERPNIFTQTVGNIDPGQEIDIEISYVDVLNYDMGTYEFHFPMVVGPRYNPGGTDRPDDADRINAAPRLAPDMRTGHDVSLRVELDAGIPIKDIATVDHEVFIGTPDETRASVSLSPADTVPNKDFVLRYDVSGEKPAMAVLNHTGAYSHDAKRLGEGYFMLMIQPGEEQEELRATPPREIVFLVDVSGSMRGEKTEQVKECMRNMLGQCRDEDRFQVVTFASQAHKLFDAPVDVNQKSISEALAYNEASTSGGGTQMLQGIQMAMDEPLEDDRVRIVVLLSDGFIGNEAQIIEHVGQNCGDQIRFWAIGIDASPNMFLIDGVAKQGGGMGKQLSPNESAEPLTTEIMSRIQRAQLANISIDFGDLEVGSTYPSRLPELWAGSPVILFGRYREGGESTIKVNGRVEGDPVSWSLDVTLSDEEPAHDVLAKTWARQAIESLMHQSFYAGSPAIEEEVTAIALNYRLMSPYTSFVAVDESEMPDPTATPPRRMMVPVPLPAYNDWSGYFGDVSGEMALDDAIDADPSLELRVLSSRDSSFSSSGLGDASQAWGMTTSESITSDFYQRGYLRGGQSLAQDSRRRVQHSFQPMADGQSSQPAQFGFQMPSRGQNLNPLYKSATLGAEVRFEFGRQSLGQIERLPLQLADLERGELEGIPINSPYESISRAYYPTDVSALIGAPVDEARDAIRLALDEAKDALEADRYMEAENHVARALYFIIISTGTGEDYSELTKEASEIQSQIREKRHAKLTSEFPQIEEPIELELRDCSLIDALQVWSDRTGIEIQWLDGSEMDVQRLMQTNSLAIDYLDLSGVAAADSLDWLLGVFQLDYVIENDAITIGSRPRLSQTSIWIHQVTPYVVPLVAETEGMEADARGEYFRQNSSEFLQTLVEQCDLDSNCRVTWFSTGQLMVMGDSNDHASIVDFLTTLAEAESDDEVPQEWRDRVRKRYLAHTGNAATIDAARRLQMNRYLIQAEAVNLLTAATAGTLDVESLTRLQIAWRELENRDDFAATVTERHHLSAWLIATTARALPDAPELAELAEFVLNSTQPHAEQCLEGLAENVDDEEMFRAAMYAALARGLDSTLANEFREIIAAVEGPPSSDARFLANVFFVEASEQVADGLVEFAGRGPTNTPDAILLILACHAEGNEAWNVFRRESPNYMGNIDATGRLAVMATRMDRGYLDSLE